MPKHPKYHTPPPPGEHYKDSTGRVYTWTDYNTVCRKGTDHPEQLSDADLGVIESFEGTAHADRYAAAREKAIHPPPPPAPPTVVSDPIALADATALILNLFKEDPDPTFDRAKYAAELRTAEGSPTSGKYDRLAFAVAYKQFRVHPAGLTDDDIATLSFIDSELGEKARAARVGYKKPVNAKLEKQLSQLPVSALALFKYVRYALHPMVDTLIFRSREAHARIDALEARLAAGKAGNFLTYCGVYDAARVYDKGNVCTYDGSMWVAKERTSIKPDELSAHGQRAWQLCVKHGRDAK